MLRALNARRPADDGIPYTVLSLRDLKWMLNKFPRGYLPYLKDFRRDFPRSRPYIWYVASFASMAFFFAIGLAFIFAH
jgi:hypothetical protein